MKSTILKSFVLGISLAALPTFAADPPDGWITTKTKLSLWTSDVRSTTVHVDTNDGVVTLSGMVPTAAQKALAEKKAREIAGVRSVKSFIQVVPKAEEKRVERKDDELKDAAQQALKDDASFSKESKFKVKNVNKGVVMLTGEAATASDHLRAVALIDRLPGVRRVASEVKAPEDFREDERISMRRTPESPVRPAPVRADDRRAQAEGSTDTGITMAVKMRLLTTAGIPSTEINVDTEDNMVTLFGIVPTDEVKRTAEQEASRVDGVKMVHNQLQVVPSAQKKVVEAKDEDITDALKTAFKDRPAFKNISTEVKAGVVRLEGKVASPWEQLNAIRAARRVEGVRNVESRLEIDPKAAPAGDRTGS